MPQDTYSFHTQISANALYYFDSNDIDNKALLIEDLEWTTQMLSPLATLQSQGRLVKTRATKDKDGMLHSTTFEVVAKLCLIACAYSDKNLEEISLPFLCLHLNHSHTQDIAIMEYQKKCKAGQIKAEDIKQAQHLLKCVIASLQNISVINPYATLINLPNDIAFPRKSFLLLLNFIEIITYFFQYQREQTADTETGEVFIKTHPNDIELAFKFLRNNLFRRADELSTSVRGFYNWLTKFLDEAKTKQFTALDLRKAKPINPRTLNRYLQELKLYSYIQVIGGNKHREGFIYKLTDFGNQKDVQSRIEQDIQSTLKNVWNAYNEEQNGQAPQEPTAESQQEPIKEEPKAEPRTEPSEEPQAEPEQEPTAEPKKGADFTYQFICSKIGAESEQTFTVKDVVAWTNGKLKTIKLHLKQLTEKGLLDRTVFSGREYIYTINRASKTVSQTPMSDTQSLTE